MEPWRDCGGVYVFGTCGDEDEGLMCVCVCVCVKRLGGAGSAEAVVEASCSNELWFLLRGWISGTVS